MHVHPQCETLLNLLRKRLIHFANSSFKLHTVPKYLLPTVSLCLQPLLQRTDEVRIKKNQDCQFRCIQNDGLLSGHGKDISVILELNYFIMRASANQKVSRGRCAVVSLTTWIKSLTTLNVDSNPTACLFVFFRTGLCSVIVQQTRNHLGKCSQLRQNKCNNENLEGTLSVVPQTSEDS